MIGIPDNKMPDCCYHCKLYIPTQQKCNYLDRECFAGTKPKDCPLIDVPIEVEQISFSDGTTQYNTRIRNDKNSKIRLFISGGGKTMQESMDDMLDDLAFMIYLKMIQQDDSTIIKK